MKNRQWSPALFLVLVLLFAPVSRADQSNGGVDERLLGSWHTVNIRGDALFFVVRGVELDFHEDGTFDARVRFTDGQTETAKGRYSLNGDRVDFTVPQLKGRESATYAIDGDKLSFHDDSFGVTIVIARGKAKDASGFDLF